MKKATTQRTYFLVALLVLTSASCATMGAKKLMSSRVFRDFETVRPTFPPPS